MVLLSKRMNVVKVQKHRCHNIVTWLQDNAMSESLLY